MPVIKEPLGQIVEKYNNDAQQSTFYAESVRDRQESLRKIRECIDDFVSRTDTLMAFIDRLSQILRRVEVWFAQNPFFDGTT